ncbi:hypothetical protein KI688_012593 [Linnemannia hyalina]|uniref:F-box domain-containing protein n=1 Tax=Linnemannia hyalina TaxID=64524 RepID=A0A9P8BSM5_9FUNG|nr:hypothetical protein KI688_012593 [Linnemannia hyalina]
MTGLSIFDIPFIIDAICENLSADDIFRCRKTSKPLHKAFLRPHWRDITVRKILTADELDTIRKHAPWIRTLTIDYPEHGVGATYDLKGTILPVLPELTLLTRIDITLDEIFNPELLFGILNVLPDSVHILEVDYEDYFDGDWKQSRVEEPWKPNKLEHICFCGADESANEDLYLIPLIKASPELQALRIPSVSSDHVDSFMEALGESCPKLRYLVLNKHKADHSWGSEATLFDHIHQPLKMLRIDLAQDRYESSIVISTLLKYSVDSLQELRLHNVDGLPDELLDKLVEKCQNLKVIYHRDNYSYQSANMMTGRGWK